MQRITKLVLPVAGLGKRLLPLTKQLPKSLVKVCGKPLVEYVLEEAMKSSIREVILIVNPLHKKQFQSYVKKHKNRFSFKFRICEQLTPGGNGHAIVQAYDFLKKAPFVVRFCDDIIVSPRPITASLADLFRAKNSPIVLLERVPKSIVSRFGVVATIGRPEASEFGFGGKIHRISNIVEKPAPKYAPSNLTIVGGYALTPHIIKNLKSIADTLPVIADDALPIAVALQLELITGGKVYGWEFLGDRLDCGTIESLKRAENYLNSGSGL